MLVLTRYISEEIIIRRKKESKDNNVDIKISILDIKNTKCRIGITADKSLSVHRSEVQQRIDAGVYKND